jgi:hypothetical protein
MTSRQQAEPGYPLRREKAPRPDGPSLLLANVWFKTMVRGESWLCASLQSGSLLWVHD